MLFLFSQAWWRVWRAIEHQGRLLHIALIIESTSTTSEEANIKCSFLLCRLCSLHSNSISYLKTIRISRVRLLLLLLITSNVRHCGGVWSPATAKFWRWWWLLIVLLVLLCHVPLLILSGSDLGKGRCVRPRVNRFDRLFLQIWDRWVLVLEKVGVFERVWLVWYLLHSLCLNLLPVVGRLRLHEQPMFL